MLARIWRARIDTLRAGDYDALIVRYARPAFAALDGCLGAFFLDEGLSRSEITLWRDAAALEAACHSDLYREMASRVAAAGLLRGRADVQVCPVTGGTVDVFGLGPQLSLTSGTHVTSPVREWAQRRRMGLMRSMVSDRAADDPVLAPAAHARSNRA